MPVPPELVSLGHVSWDVFPDTAMPRMPGGAAAYATVLARHMGVGSAIVTAAAGDYPIDEVAPPELRAVIQSDDTTTFESRHDLNGVRTQRLMSRASIITSDIIPDEWREPDVLFVGPLDRELPLDCADWFRPRLSCVVPQGWCRSWTDPLPSDVVVTPKVPEGFTEGWDICVISEHETTAEGLAGWLAVADYVVVTRGQRGATLYERGSSRGKHVPAAGNVPNVGRDETGAGDVFAAAMVIGMANGRAALEAAESAAEWAARCTTAPSWRGIL